MSDKDKQLLFDTARYHLHSADQRATEWHRVGSVTRGCADEMVLHITKALASAQQFQSVMAGNEPPKTG